MKALVSLLLFVLLAVPASGQEAITQGDPEFSPVAHSFSYADNGRVARLPTMTLPPGLYVYMILQGRKNEWDELSPQIQIVESPPACGANWNKNPFGARGAFTYAAEHSARSVDLFWVLKECELIVSIVRNEDNIRWRFAIVKVIEMSPEVLLFARDGGW